MKRTGLTTAQVQTLIDAFGDAADHVYLFGSRARGDHRPQSDVDLLVDPDDRFDGVARQHVLGALEDAGFPFKVDVVRISELAESYQRLVLAQRRPLLLLGAGLGGDH